MLGGQADLGGGGHLPPGYSLSPKELHPQKGKDDDEEEEEEEEADDGLHGVQEGDHQVPQGSPVPARAEPGCGGRGGTRAMGGQGDVKGHGGDEGTQRQRGDEGRQLGTQAPHDGSVHPHVLTRACTAPVLADPQTRTDQQTDGQADGQSSGAQPVSTYFVTLKMRSNLRARSTLIPKDVPGFTTAQITSKMLPMIT